jgi:hypothetical protein
MVSTLVRSFARWLARTRSSVNSCVDVFNSRFQSDDVQGANEESAPSIKLRANERDNLGSIGDGVCLMVAQFDRTERAFSGIVRSLANPRPDMVLIRSQFNQVGDELGEILSTCTELMEELH